MANPIDILPKIPLIPALPSTGVVAQETILHNNISGSSSFSFVEPPRILLQTNQSPTLFSPLPPTGPSYSIVPFRRDEELTTAGIMAARAIRTLRTEGYEAKRGKALLRTAIKLEAEGNTRGATMLHRVLFARGFAADETKAAINSLNASSFQSLKNLQLFVEKEATVAHNAVGITELFEHLNLRGSTLQDFIDILSVGGNSNQLAHLVMASIYEKICRVSGTYEDENGLSNTSMIGFSLEHHRDAPLEIHGMSVEIDPKLRGFGLATHQQLAFSMFMKRQGIRKHLALLTGEGCLSWPAMGVRIDTHKMARAKEAVIELVDLGIISATAVADVESMDDKAFARLKISKRDVLDADKFEVWLGTIIRRPSHAYFDKGGQIALGITALSKTSGNVVSGVFKADRILGTLFGGYVEKKLLQLQKLSDSLLEREAYLAAISSHNALAKYYAAAIPEYDLLKLMPPPVF